jgi:hypothetical protein
MFKNIISLSVISVVGVSLYMYKKKNTYKSELYDIHKKDDIIYIDETDDIIFDINNKIEDKKEYIKKVLEEENKEKKIKEIIIEIKEIKKENEVKDDYFVVESSNDETDYEIIDNF